MVEGDPDERLEMGERLMNRIVLTINSMGIVTRNTTPMLLFIPKHPTDASYCYAANVIYTLYTDTTRILQEYGMDNTPVSGTVCIAMAEYTVIWAERALDWRDLQLQNHS